MVIAEEPNLSVSERKSKSFQFVECFCFDCLCHVYIFISPVYMCDDIYVRFAQTKTSFCHFCFTFQSQTYFEIVFSGWKHN